MGAPVEVLAPTTKDSFAVPAAPVIPLGMVEVTEEDFWAAVRTEKRDVMPSPQRLYTDWLFNGTRNQWGWVSRGYASPYGIAPIYALARVKGVQP